MAASLVAFAALRVVLVSGRSTSVMLEEATEGALRECADEWDEEDAEEALELERPCPREIMVCPEEDEEDEYEASLRDLLWVGRGAESMPSATTERTRLARSDTYPPFDARFNKIWECFTGFGGSGGGRDKDDELEEYDDDADDDLLNDLSFQDG